MNRHRSSVSFHPSRTDGGWILAETLVATLIGALAIAAGIHALRGADNLALNAQRRAEAVTLATSILERTRADLANAPPTANGAEAGFTWTVETERSIARESWRAPIAKLSVDVRWKAGDQHRHVTLSTLAPESRQP